MVIALFSKKHYSVFIYIMSNMLKIIYIYFLYCFIIKEY